MKAQIDTANKLVWCDSTCNLSNLYNWLLAMFPDFADDFMLVTKRLSKSTTTDIMLPDFIPDTNSLYPWHEPFYRPTIMEDEMFGEVSQTYDYMLTTIVEGVFTVEFLSV